MTRVVLGLQSLQAYQRGVLAGVRQYAVEFGQWHLRFEDAFDLDPSHVQHANADGLILEFSRREVALALNKRRVPTVSLFNNFPDLVHLSSVWLDNRAIGQFAADYFVKKRFPHAAAIGVPLNFSQLRIDGFVDRLKSKGFTPRVHFAPSERQVAQPLRWNTPSLDDGAIEFLRSLPGGTAIFATSDRLAFSIASMCEALGIGIPHKLMLLGVDNDEAYCLATTTGISSISVNWVGLGYRAAELLSEVLTGQAKPGTSLTMKPDRVVERSSSTYTPTDDADVAEVVRYIRANYAKPIRVEDMSAHVGVPKRSLQRRFKDALGHGISDELRTVRLGEVSRLLETTDWSIDIIAHRCGFAGANWLSRVFVQEFGQTPGAFRNIKCKRMASTNRTNCSAAT